MNTTAQEIYFTQLNPIPSEKNPRYISYDSDQYFSETPFVAMARALGMKSELDPVIYEDRVYFHLEGSVQVVDLDLSGDYGDEVEHQLVSPLDLLDAYMVDGESSALASVSLFRKAAHYLKKLNYWSREILRGHRPSSDLAAV